MRVVVSGGGPAGAMAAWGAARAGHKVVLFEQSQPFRDKLCSGIIAPHTRELLEGLPIPWDVVAVGRFHYTHVEWGRIRVGLPHREVLIVSRSRFDQALRDLAREAGADVRYGTAVKAYHAHGVTLADGTTWEGDRVVAADGAYGPGTHFVAGGPADHAVGLKKVRTPLSSTTSVLRVFYEPSRYGYGWDFPHAEGEEHDRGVMISPRGPHARQAMAEWAGDGPVKGYWIPVAVQQKLTREGVVLAGDAAGAVEPLLGEGIPYACWTGWQAATLPLQAYEARAKAALARRMRLGLFIRGAVERPTRPLGQAAILVLLGLPWARRWLWRHMLENPVLPPMVDAKGLAEAALSPTPSALTDTTTD